MEYIRSYFHTPTEMEIKSPVYATWAGHRICTPQHSIGPRVLENYKLVLVIKGKGTFRQAGNQFEISAGDLFVLFPGVKHFYATDPRDPWELMWVSFNGLACVEITGLLSLTPDTPVLRDAATGQLIQIMGNIVNDFEYQRRIYPQSSALH